MNYAWYLSNLRPSSYLNVYYVWIQYSLERYWPAFSNITFSRDPDKVTCNWIIWILYSVPVVPSKCFNFNCALFFVFMFSPYLKLFSINIETQISLANCKQILFLFPSTLYSLCKEVFNQDITDLHPRKEGSQWQKLYCIVFHCIVLCMAILVIWQVNWIMAKKFILLEDTLIF